MLADFGVTAAFMAPAIASVLAVLLFLPVHTRQAVREPNSSTVASVLRDTVDGLAYIRGHAVILGLILIGLVAVVFGSPYQTVLPVFARDVLHSGEVGLGILGATGGAGAIAASLLVAAYNGPTAMRNYIVLGSLTFGGFVVAFALSSILILSVVFALAAGFVFQLLLTANSALLQVLVPDRLRGRVASVRSLMWGVAPLGIFSLGGMAEVVGTQTATAILGVFTLLACGSTLAVLPSLRRAHQLPAEDGAAEI